MGWMLLGFGGLMVVPGILTVTELVPVELAFFGIEVDTQWERLVWTVASIVSAIVGYAILRNVRGDDDER